jgi:hypothetical protein
MRRNFLKQSIVPQALKLRCLSGILLQPTPRQQCEGSKFAADFRVGVPRLWKRFLNVESSGSVGLFKKEDPLGIEPIGKRDTGNCGGGWSIDG